MLLITVFSGMIMTMPGIIGEYLWRILDNVRQSPPYLIDGIQPLAPAATAEVGMQETMQAAPQKQRK